MTYAARIEMLSQQLLKRITPHPEEWQLVKCKCGHEMSVSVRGLLPGRATPMDYYATIDCLWCEKR